MHLSLWDIALQTVNFVVLAWLLQRFLFKPVRAVLVRREQAVTASMQQAKLAQDEAARALAEYREKAADLPAQAERAREAAQKSVEAEAETIRATAARQAASELEHAKGELLRERAEALEALEGRAAELATSIAERLLGDVAPESDAAFLWRLTASVDALEPARRAALVKSLASGDVELVSARPLAAPARERFESWVAALAGHVPAVLYRVDASLVAGVELRLPTGVWRSHWRASLERIRAELGNRAAAA